MNPDSNMLLFVADMEGKTYNFQVRVTVYNFTENHKTFTITRVVDEVNHVPVPAVADNISIMCII